MNMLMYKFDKLKEGMFGAPIATLPHNAYTSGLAPVVSQPQYGRSFHYHYDQNRFVFSNKSELASSAPETDRDNLGEVSTNALYFLLLYTLNLVSTS
jgi:hypothetical protein